MSRLENAEKILGWFRRDTAKHEMQVLHNAGTYRHIRFKTPGTSICYFDVVTWPGYLAYTGDMGCYVFTRVEDMFDFFRGRIKADGAIPINPGYWSEKLEGADRSDGAKEYSEDRFREHLIDHIKSWKESGDLPEDRETRRELFQAIRNGVWDITRDGHETAMRAVADFEHEGFQFSDFWEHDCTVFTTRFVWCCYALVWAISQYDAAMKPAPAQAA